MIDTVLKAKADLEVAEMLRATELFEDLAAAEVLDFAAAGRIRVLERGQLLFRRGDPSDRLYLLMDGAVEIIRATSEQGAPVPVAYITPGELVGDMALFTGTPRGSDGRIPEVAMVWELTNEDFDEIAERIAGYGMTLARMFACRMQELITHMRRQTRRKELAGKLCHFDMPTVVQTLINAKQNGLLSFMDDEGKTFAEVMLANGVIDRAWCGPLHGEEAFTEIFLLREEGEFIFRSTGSLDPESISPKAIEAPAMHLLMEAMRRADELAKLREELPDLKRIFEAATTSLDWPDPADTDIAQAVLRLLRSPRPLEGLHELVPCSTYTFCRVVQILVETGQVTPV